MPWVVHEVSGRAEVGPQACLALSLPLSVALPLHRWKAQWAGLGPESHILFLVGPMTPLPRIKAFL